MVPPTSAYNAEVLALPEAFIYFLGFSGNENLFFYTNCLSLVTALNALRITTEEVHDLKISYFQLSGRYSSCSPSSCSWPYKST